VQGPHIISGIVAAAMICVNIYDVFILKLGLARQGVDRQSKGKARQDREREGNKGDDRAEQGRTRQ
jgi:hypothetical protein